MSEGEQGMPNPEQQRPVSGPEQTPEKTPQAVFEENLRGLIEPQVTKNEQGEEVTGPPVITDENLAWLVKGALAFGGKTPEGLTQIIDKGNSLCLDGVVKKEEGGWAQWGELVVRLEEHRDFLTREKQAKREAPASSTMKVDLSPIDRLADRILAAQEGVLDSNRMARESSERLIGALTGYAETMREAYSQLSPGEEQERWVDVELQQDFYTRFTPNMEPRFYTRLESSERREWDARWQLARAAFWKKIYSADTEKLAQNQDLIELTTEQMELLYNIEGVREGLVWYTKTILERVEITGEDNNGQQIRLRKSLVECESGREFEEFRNNLQDYLKRNIFGITEERENGMSEEEKQELRIKIKSVDAIAWNWIWVSNLVESVDSRYNTHGDLSLRIRHGNLAPAVCSDDLRALFHPQEKYEDKASSGQEWGAFGKWGVLQMNRIKREVAEINSIREREGRDNLNGFIFIGADSPSKFWKIAGFKKVWDERKGKEEERVVVFVPECYPVTSMSSFWETYNEEVEEENKPSLLSRLIAGEEINWKKTRTDPWKTNYLTIVLNKSNQLFKYFKPGVSLEMQKFGYAKEWSDPIIDIFTRLRLRDVYRNIFGKEEGERQFHNLKCWAVFAATGGVGQVDRKAPTTNLGPFDKSILKGALADKNVRFLEKEEGEDLTVK